MTARQPERLISLGPPGLLTPCRGELLSEAGELPGWRQGPSAGQVEVSKMLTAGMDRSGRHALVLVGTVSGARRFAFPIELRPCVWTQARRGQRLWPNDSHTRYGRRPTEAMPRGLRSCDGRLLAHDHVPRRQGARTLMRTARETSLEIKSLHVSVSFVSSSSSTIVLLFVRGVPFVSLLSLLFFSIQLHLHNSEASPLLVLSLFNFPFFNLFKKH